MVSATKTISVHQSKRPKWSTDWLWHLELIWLMVLAIPVLLPGLLIANHWQRYLVFALFLFWPFRRFFTSSETPNTRLSLAIKVLICWLPINILTAGTSVAAVNAVGYLLFGIALYGACIHHPWLVQRPLHLSKFLLVITTALLLAIPFVQWKSSFRLFYVPFYDWFSQNPFSIGEQIHANVFAGALIVLLPIVIALALPPREQQYRIQLATDHNQKEADIYHVHLYRKRQILPLIATLLSVIMVFLLILTQSRGAYLATSVAVAIIFLMRWRRLVYAIPVVALCIGVLIYQIGLDTIFSILGADNTFGGADWRTTVWHTSWRAFQDFPWTGIGIGNFKEVMGLLYPNPIVTSPSATHAHNLLLQIGLDLGLPGLIAWLTFYVTMIVMTVTVLYRTHTPAKSASRLNIDWDIDWDGQAFYASIDVGVTISKRRFIHDLMSAERTRQHHWALATGCLAALIALQIHGLLDAVTWGNKLAFIPWLLFAQVTILYRKS